MREITNPDKKEKALLRGLNPGTKVGGFGETAKLSLIFLKNPYRTPCRHLWQR